MRCEQRNDSVWEELSLEIFTIPDMGEFLDLVVRSKGDITLHLPDGKQLDLKRSHSARQLLQSMCPGQSGLHISLSDPVDAPAFIQYMMEAGAS